MVWRRCLLPQQTFNGKTNVFKKGKNIARRLLNLEHVTKAEAAREPGLLPSVSALAQGDHKKNSHEYLKKQIRPNREDEGSFKLLISPPKATHQMFIIK